MNFKHLLVLLMGLVSITVTKAQAYRYPVIPDSIIEGNNRVLYLANHFWDNADFEDDTLLTKPKVILDYLYVLYLLPEKEASVNIRNSILLLSKYPKQFHLLLIWLERYLHNPQSPYFNDELFSWTVDAILQTDLDDESTDIWIRQSELLTKNRLGEKAEDFSFIDKDGQTMQLYDIVAPYLMIIFNNPDCSHCKKTEELISRNDTIQLLINSDKLTVLAICPDIEYDCWVKHQYPSNWISGFDSNGTIIKEMLYEIQQYPSLYLLDGRKIVLLKEANYESVCKYINMALRNHLPTRLIQQNIDNQQK